MMKNFMEELLKVLREKKDEEYDFQIMEVTKLNDSQKLSICARKKGDSIGVNLYMEDLVRRYNSIGRDLNGLAEDILSQIRENLLDSAFTGAALKEMSDMLDFDKMKDKVLFRIINAEDNKEYLKHSVYVPFLDFAICFYHTVGNAGETGTIHLTAQVAEAWGVSVDEIYEHALKNTPIRMPYRFRNIEEVLEQLMREDSFSQCMNPPEFGKENFSLWVLGNEKQMFGAGAILYDGLMREISERMGADEIVILPSSVHECLLLPMTEEVEVSYLRNMVHEVNATKLAPEERLSENVYLYSRETDEISILTEQEA